MSQPLLLAANHLHISLTCDLVSFAILDFDEWSFVFFFFCFVASWRNMNTTSTHFVPPRRFEVYEPLNQIGMWEESFKNNGDMYTPGSIIIPTNEKPDSLVLQSLLYISDKVNSETNACFNLCSVRGYFSWDRRNSSQVWPRGFHI